MRMTTICNKEGKQKIRKETKFEKLLSSRSPSLTWVSRQRAGRGRETFEKWMLRFPFFSPSLSSSPSLPIFPPFLHSRIIREERVQVLQKRRKRRERGRGICSKGCLMTSIPHSVCLAAIVICLAVPIWPQVAGTVILIVPFSSLNSSILSPFRIKWFTKRLPGVRIINRDVILDDLISETSGNKTKSQPRRRKRLLERSGSREKETKTHRNQSWPLELSRASIYLFKYIRWVLVLAFCT